MASTRICVNFPWPQQKITTSLHLLDLRLISVLMWELYDETLLSWWVWFYPEWLRPQLQDILIYFMVCWEWKSWTLAFTHHNTYERRSSRRYPSLGYSYIIYYRYLRFTFFSLWSTLFCRLCYKQTTLFNLLSVFSYFVQGEEESKRPQSVNASIGIGVSDVKRFSDVWNILLVFYLHVSLCTKQRPGGILHQMKADSRMICLLKRTFQHYQLTLKMSLLIWKRYMLISVWLCLLQRMAWSRDLLSWGRLNYKL